MKILIKRIEGISRHYVLRYKPLLGTIHNVLEIRDISGITYYCIHDTICNSHAGWSKLWFKDLNVIKISDDIEVDNELDLLKLLLVEMLIEFDELGLEPTTLTPESGKEIVNRWRAKFKLYDFNYVKKEGK